MRVQLRGDFNGNAVFENVELPGTVSIERDMTVQFKCMGVAFEGDISTSRWT